MLSKQYFKFGWVKMNWISCCGCARERRQRRVAAAAVIIKIHVVGKIGTVFESGDLKPHRDYIVNPSWVSGLLEASALTVICRDVFSLC